MISIWSKIFHIICLNQYTLEVKLFQVPKLNGTKSEIDKGRIILPGSTSLQLEYTKTLS